MAVKDMGEMSYQQMWLHLQRALNDVGLALLDPKADYYPSYHVRRLLGMCQAWTERVEAERQAAAVSRIHDMVEWNQMGPGVKDEEAAHKLFMDGQEYNELSGQWDYPDYDPSACDSEDPPEAESDEEFYSQQGYPDHD